MTVVISGGKRFYMNHLLKDALDVVIKRVQKKNWDYVAIVAGLPRSGKSTLARICAKYCDPDFDAHKVAFTDEEFIKTTNEVPDYSAVVLDESFQSFNTKIAMSPAFVRIINHLQIIAQKHLFIFLVLPNYFDLTKFVAMFRSSHLFVTVTDDEGNRGDFIAFGRHEKKKLYILGSKFVDYNAVRPNFRGDFYESKGIINEEAYNRKKHMHLMSQETAKKPSYSIKKIKFDRVQIAKNLREQFGMTWAEVGKAMNMHPRKLQDLVNPIKVTYINPEQEQKETNSIQVPMPTRIPVYA